MMQIHNDIYNTTEYDGYHISNSVCGLRLHILSTIHLAHQFGASWVVPVVLTPVAAEGQAVGGNALRALS